MEELLQINSQKKGAITRRSFLKGLGVASAVGAVGCSDDLKQKVLPNIKGNEERILSVPEWYRSSCTECAAGCGIEVRVNDGRATKLEGSASHPVNKGGLCAIGHSALQDLYDPDRIRQPLKKNSDGGFTPITWEEAEQVVVQKLKLTEGKKRAFIHSGKGSALQALLENWCRKLDVAPIRYETVSRSAEAKAAELVYGVSGIPTYSFEKSEVTVSFGADFLETWISPVEFAKGFSKSRTSGKPGRVIQIEPRMSLTAANADTWHCSRPGSELYVALSILKGLFGRGFGDGLSSEVRAKIGTLVRDIDVEKASKESGISVEKLLLIEEYLARAKRSLVIAGGAASSTANPLPLMVAVNLLNLLLGNVGETVSLAKVRQEKGSLAEISALTEVMAKGEVPLLFIDRSNPDYHLPSDFGFAYARKKVLTLVSFASHMDETTATADIILPTNVSLESWGDHRPVTGVYNLMQPVMRPVFQTKMLGDALISIASSAGVTDLAEGEKDFGGYLKAHWKQLHSELGVAQGFDKFWLESLERGGYFDQSHDSEKVRVKVSDAAFDLDFNPAKISPFKGEQADVTLFPFPSVRSFDGRSANRPWLTEVPDPMSQVVWDGWVEIHPSTAAKFGLAKGDVATVRNHFGELNFPVYVTEYIHPEMVAVPIGHGHKEYGRFAADVGGNVFELLPKALAAKIETLPLVNTKVELIRARIKRDIVTPQGSDSQENRGIGMTTFLGANGAALGHNEEGSSHHKSASEHVEADHEGAEHEGSEEAPKQMYVQREHPLYHWGMSVDLAACTGCSACVVACFSENNIPVVGKQRMSQGREMAWLHIERYFDESKEGTSVSLVPMMCQHCNSAPCEPVCPVYATYHNEEGLNVMVYNRCVGTRYCANNCPYKVRRFNWQKTEWPEPMNWLLNPNVMERGMGVMEKCTFCVQRIVEAKDTAKDEGRVVRDGEVKPACVQSCPTDALSFGNLNDPNSKVSKMSRSSRKYKILDHNLNTQPAVTYLQDLKIREV